jgi:hypothetical protein
MSDLELSFKVKWMAHQAGNPFSPGPQLFILVLDLIIQSLYAAL